MTEPIEKIKTEIQSAIDEIREKEKYHASCIKENNKFVIMGLEIALDIIKRNKNDRTDNDKRSFTDNGVNINDQIWRYNGF